MTLGQGAGGGAVPETAAEEGRPGLGLGMPHQYCGVVPHLPAGIDEPPDQVDVLAVAQ
jgi:hypothetical protein